MLKNVEAKCKQCETEFCKKRTEHEFCSAQCRNAAWKKPRKRRLKGTPRGSVAHGSFSPTNSVACKAPHTPDFGVFVRAHIEAQQDRPNPISFALPDGTKGRVWPSHREGSKIIGDERLWRVNLEELLRKQERRPKLTPWTPTIEALCRPIIVVGLNESVRDIDDALGVIKGFRVRLCIEAEKELQVLCCGWRIVTCQFRGKHVLLHHSGNTATMKRKAFKELVAAMRAIRPKRPTLRLVVSNPSPLIARAEAA
jgi:hypothetical protein